MNAAAAFTPEERGSSAFGAYYGGPNSKVNRSRVIQAVADRHNCTTQQAAAHVERALKECAVSATSKTELGVVLAHLDHPRFIGSPKGDAMQDQSASTLDQPLAPLFEFSQAPVFDRLVRSVCGAAGLGPEGYPRVVEAFLAAPEATVGVALDAAHINVDPAMLDASAPVVVPAEREYPTDVQTTRYIKAEARRRGLDPFRDFGRVLLDVFADPGWPERVLATPYTDPGNVELDAEVRSYMRRHGMARSDYKRALDAVLNDPGVMGDREPQSHAAVDPRSAELHGQLKQYMAAHGMRPSEFPRVLDQYFAGQITLGA